MRHNTRACPACDGQHVMGRRAVHVAAGAPDKISRVMHEAKAGTLHSGSKTGPIATDPKQQMAIALSEQRKANRGGS